MPRARRTVAPRLTEADIERTCTGYLGLDGWRTLKTDPCSDRARGKGFGEKGMADCLYVRYVERHYEGTCNAHVLWIEWKRPGGQLSPHQAQWHTIERKRGALTWIAGVDFEASIDGFLAHYRASGLNRGKV